MKIDGRYFTTAHRFISREETRFYIGAVQIEPHPDGNGAMVIATNGTAMAVFHDPDGHVADNEAGLYMLDFMSLEYIQRALTANHCEEKLTFDWFRIGDGEMTDIQVSTGRDGFDAHIDLDFGAPPLGDALTLNVMRIPGTFVDWRKVMPKEIGHPLGALTINPRRLEPFRFCGGLVGSGGHDSVSVYRAEPGLSEKYGPDGRPLVVLTGHGNFIGALMPMHMPQIAPFKSLLSAVGAKMIGGLA